jgi:ABC-2 type transport system permease protein
MQRLRVLIWKEFLELRLNPRLFGLVIVAPIIQLTLLGYAATTDVRDIPIVVADGDRSAASRDLAHRFDATRNFTVIGMVNTVNEIEPYLESGAAWLAVVIPSGFGSDMGSGRVPTVQVAADGTDSNSTTVALGYATALIGEYAAISSRLKPASTENGSMSGRLRPASTIDPRIRVWFNPQLESRHFMIPGVLALVLLVVTANLAAMAIVREKEVGTLEQLNVTPLRRWELIAGKLLPYGLIGMVDVLLVVAVAVFWFEVPLRGSFALLFALSMIYVLCTLGLGLFVSTISATQQQAMMTAVFFFLMPMIYLSGFVFPIENMPAVIQAVTYVVPLRYFLVIVRGIFLKGVGMEVLWPQVAALSAWGIVVISLAVMRSRKTLN